MENANMNPIQAMIKFAYFTANFDYNFIENCWKDEPLTATHLRVKLSHYTDKENKGYVTYNAFMQFFLNLDNFNQSKLCQYIIETYKG